MGTITAFPDPIHGYVYLEVDWSDRPELTQVTVFRVVVATGQESIVRVHTQTDHTGEPIILNGGTATLYDTEAPLDTPIYYRAEGFGFSAVHIMNVNPFFETDTTDWVTENANGVISRSTAQFHQGVASLLMTPTGGAATGILMVTAYPVIYNNPYVASVWMRSSNGWPAVTMVVQFVDATGTPIVETPAFFNLVAGVWTYGTIDTVAPLNAVAARIRIRQDGTPAVTDLLYIDEAELIGEQLALATSGELVLASSSGLWLKDPLRPYNDRRIVLKYNGSACVPGQALYFSGLADESYANRGDLPIVVNKRNPIAVSRTRGGMSSTLGLVARTFTDRDLLKETLAPGSVLFLQAPSKYGMGDVYTAIGDVDISRMSNDMRKQWRQFKIPFAETDRPAGLMFGTLGARWMDMCDVYPTFATATAAGISWHDVMQGMAGTGGEGVIVGWATWSSVVGRYATWTAVVAGNTTWTKLVEG